MRALIVSSALLMVAGCRRAVPAAPASDLAGTEAVRVLRGDDSPYRIIYYQPVELSKR
jgi:hypothetical protein